MADPSRQMNESGGRENPPRLRSVDDRQVGNVANPIDANNNAGRNLDDDTPSPDSQVVTSTIPEDLDSSQEIVQARESSEATPPSSVESPSLEDDLPLADSPENREVTSTSNLNSHSAINSPPILQGIAGMSIDECGLNVQSNAPEIASSSRQIPSSSQEVSRRRHDQNLNLSVQIPTLGVERCDAASDETPLSVICRRLLNSHAGTTASRQPVLQRQSTSSLQRRPASSMGLREHLTATPRPNITTHLTRPPTLISIETPSAGQRMAVHLTTSSNRPPMSIPVTTSVMNPPTYASVHSSIRPPPFVPFSANRQSSSFSTPPKVSSKQPVQTPSTRPSVFMPSSSKPKTTMMSSNKSSLVPTSSTRPQSPVPFFLNRPSTLVITPSTILFHTATFNTFAHSSLKSSPSPTHSSSIRPPSPSSSTRPLPEPIAARRISASRTSTSVRPSIPRSSSSMTSKHSTSSKTMVSYTDRQQKVAVTTSSTSFKSSDCARTSMIPLQKPPTLSSQLTCSKLAKRTKETLKNIHVPKVSINHPNISSKSPESLAQSPEEKSPTKRQANTPTQGTSNDSNNTDNISSPTKKLKIAFRVGEGSKQSKKDGSSESAAEVKCDVMDDDSVSEIPSSEESDPKNENSF